MASPLPFGVLRVHHATSSTQTTNHTTQSPLPFGVLRVHHDRALLPPPADKVQSPLPFGVLRVHHIPFLPVPRETPCRLHCLSAFSAFTTQPRRTPTTHLRRLHCLSA